MKALILAAYAACIAYVHVRGKVRHKLSRQLSDHSSFLAPLNCFMYLFSRVPNTPYLTPNAFPEMQKLTDNWEVIRAEALRLREAGSIKRSEQYNDVGFNSFFKTGWKRFYLKWYDDAHPSADVVCPQTTALLREIPSVKAAMFAELPPGSRLVRHRDPYAGSLRYHLGLFTPNDEGCFIEVDGQRYAWKDGEAVVFDETYIHYAENTTEHDRVILFCDVERPLKYRWAQAFNRWFSRNVMAAAASPNDDGDKTGGINRAFGTLYKIRLQGKALKKRNRKLYYLQKWAFFGAILAFILWV
ncbi:beta-hydroxylase [Pseudomonas citronellolis]|jgi:beta-hydroxylase|uniref:Beta-hydroxylase n=1 Tax=Pseudomonas citronellolis TaxID=53408 RepID=A0A1A9K7J4_9PSED|nr:MULTISPECIES: lipid A hydroxylase LpxO [Pseudomonas]ANI13439.1 aspartyl beta-hydroxylase [Pseudomonas citronellolis]KES21681.1 aspartyl beta-hydroxylase [Pseudomonas sp. AAC]MBB1607770.1 aspartyl beta-hydroxylase [Pseudomonas sp. UMC76]MBB1638950.1 aspartyl beta-hydroxylase [Pseudomonas sp. UME83]MBH3433089.1 lipid A hydroxylase LpxO [Pseudomonas citronellolis]